MGRLRSVSFVFPNRTPSEKEWCARFQQLLEEIPAYKSDKQFRPAFAEDAFPLTVFAVGNTATPAILLDTNERFHFDFAHLKVVDTGSLQLGLSVMSESLTAHFDAEFSQMQPNTITHLLDCLKGRLTGMDHSGINIPVTSTSSSTWQELMTKLATITNLYRYPGEDWPFVIPANEEEYKSDITRFDVKRTPKFELVYDSYTNKPLIQFALETDISREEMERLFPEPIGFAIPGLDDIFRSMFIQSPWDQDLTFRFDLYFRSDESELSDWETGEWLVKNGGRWT